MEQSSNPKTSGKTAGEKKVYKKPTVEKHDRLYQPGLGY